MHHLLCMLCDVAEVVDVDPHIDAQLMQQIWNLAALPVAPGIAIIHTSTVVG